ncbi:MAG: hypothetical protein ACHQ2F_06950 [Desulfobaccales bacterium]
MVLLFCGDLAWATETRKVLQLEAQIQPRASLSLSRTQISFDGREDQRIIPSQEEPVQVTVKVRTGPPKSVILNVRAESDLEGLSGAIPINRVQWTAQGSGTSTGLLSKTAEQLVGRWTNSGIFQTLLQFALKNDGNFLPGICSTFVDFTLTSP